MNVKEEQKVKIVELPVRIDVLSAQSVDELLTAILHNNHRSLICDFVNTEYISSAGLRVLLSVLKRMKKLGGRLYLCSLKPGIAEIFAMAGFLDLFTVFPSEADALDNMLRTPSMKTDEEGSEEKLNSVLSRAQKEKAISAYTGQKM